MQLQEPAAIGQVQNLQTVYKFHPTLQPIRTESQV